MVKIGTVINFCSLDYRFIGSCIRAVSPFSARVVVPWADHLFDNTPEDAALVEKAAGENPEAAFVRFEYHHSITRMLRSRFWHNYARWVGLAHLPEDCEWILFLDADEIVETDRFMAFVDGTDLAPYDHLYFANYWYFREPRFRARQIEDSPAMIRRSLITVNRIFHEHERANFRRYPRGARRVPGLDGRPMFHHYSWVMDKDQMMRKVGTWGHSLDTDKDWNALVDEEFSREFSGKDFVHGYDFDVVEPLIDMEADPVSSPEASEERFVLPERDAIAAVDLSPLARFVAQTDDLGYFLDTDFQEHYRLLASLSTRFCGQTIFDIGTYRGYSALALGYGRSNKVVSYDIQDSRSLHDPETLGHIEFALGDVLSDPRLLEAPLVFIDINHDGVSEQRIYDFLDRNGYRGLVVLDDIHLNPAMERFWESIRRPKEDITHLGHVTGTGIVFFTQEPAAENANTDSVSLPVKGRSKGRRLCIAFHSNQLGLRGTDVALYDYAYYNREILGNSSVILSDKNADLSGLEKFQSQFDVLLYDNFAQVPALVQNHGMDAVYLQKAGQNDGKLVPGVPNLVHAVFQCFEPHGDVYAYISSWLSEKMTGGRYPFVPYMVTLPDTDDDYRKTLGIPPNALVFGRHGGWDQFDIPFVREVVAKVAAAAPHIFFLFMNTEPFCDSLDNVIHLNPTWDMTAKTRFINTCDAMLHARQQGETFGLAVAEFLFRDKPVIAWADGIDQNHLTMLGDDGLYYRSPGELFDRLIGFERIASRGTYRNRVAGYTPEKVMERFHKVFLETVQRR